MGDPDSGNLFSAWLLSGWSCWAGCQSHTARHLSLCRKTCASLGDKICQMSFQWSIALAIKTLSPDVVLPTPSHAAVVAALPTSSAAATPGGCGLITPDKSYSPCGWVYLSAPPGRWRSQFLPSWSCWEEVLSGKCMDGISPLLVGLGFLG